MPEQSIRLTGGCQCGAIRFALASKPATPGICHCRMCQKAGGSPFMAFAGLPTADVTWTRGVLSTFESSTIATRGFCSACGTPLTYQAKPDRISFTIGSFDEPAAIVPVEQLGLESVLPWSEHISELEPVPSAQTGPDFVNNQHPDHDT